MAMAALLGVLGTAVNADATVLPTNSAGGLEIARAVANGAAVPADFLSPAGANLSPKAQTVTGCGNCTGVSDQANFTLTGGTVPSNRFLSHNFAECGGCPSRKSDSGATGSSYLFFAPLGCTGKIGTVYGTIVYPTGSVSDSASVTLSNPQGCSE